jgi:hypothetical protein
MTGKVIFATKFGSYLYGTVTPESDLDVKSVRVPCARDILLQRIERTVTENTKSNTCEKNTPSDIDRETWALHEFFRLVREGQTVAMDALFAPSFAWTQPANPLWLDIIHHRHRFLSRRAGSFLGYCRQQANKYGIKGSRMHAAERARAVLRGLLERDTNADLGDVQSDFAPLLATIEHVEIVDIPTPSGGAVRHLSVCGRKAPYTSSLKSAFDMYHRLFEQYGERARQAKQNQGIDWKALSHAVRVGREARELLTTGHITFPRPEGQYLVAIKKGQIPYGAVADDIERMLEQVELAAKESSLPEEPDHALMDDMIFHAYALSVDSRL